MADKEQAAAVAEVERILRVQTEGFPWAPLPDPSRYGWWRGLALPMIMNLFTYTEPPVVDYAPQAGREDWQAVQRARRTSAAPNDSPVTP